MEPPIGPPLAILLADIFDFFFSNDALVLSGDVDVTRFLTGFFPAEPAGVDCGGFCWPALADAGVILADVLRVVVPVGGVLVAALKYFAHAPAA